MPARLRDRGGRDWDGTGKGPLQYEEPVRGTRAAVPDRLDRLTEQPAQVVLVHPVGRQTSGEEAVRREGLLISPAPQTSLGALGVDGDIPGRLPVFSQGREPLGQRQRPVPVGVGGGPFDSMARSLLGEGLLGPRGPVRREWGPRPLPRRPHRVPVTIGRRGRSPGAGPPLFGGSNAANSPEPFSSGDGSHPVPPPLRRCGVG